MSKGDERPAALFELRGGFLKPLMRCLPPPPPGQRKLETSWRDTFSCSSWRTVAAALGMLALVVTAVAGLRNFTVMRISVMSLVIGVAKVPFDGFHGLSSVAPPLRSGGEVNATAPALWTQLFGTALVVVFAGLFLRWIPNFALREEQEFREGCESWSPHERAKACVIFGGAHLSNFWYPLASVVALSMGGGIFMWWYSLEYHRSLHRELAVRHAAALHAIYNGIVVSILALLLLVGIWW